MDERPSAGSGVGYVIVLVGVAGFVLSCFLPYTTFGVVVGGGNPASSTFSFYRLITRNTPGGGTLQYVGGLLFLFGGAATVAWVALAGLRHGHHERRRTPSILVAVTVAWSLSWIGLLVNASGLYEDEVGFWSMLASAGVIVGGTVVVWVSTRHTAHEPDSAADPDPPRGVPVD